MMEVHYYIRSTSPQNDRSQVIYIQMKGAIFIQPDDYSIHKLEYSASFLNSEKKNKEIFNIEIEYGHEPAVNSRMCLKYISFNNSFIIPDSSDNDFFKIVRIRMEASWWPLC